MTYFEQHETVSQKNTLSSYFYFDNQRYFFPAEPRKTIVNRVAKLFLVCVIKKCI
jgi:hypothetical protein